MVSFILNTRYIPCYNQKEMVEKLTVRIYYPFHGSVWILLATENN